MTSRANTTASAPRKITERKLAANRRNAQKSTGPKTAAGKAKSRWNATKHGLLARHTIIQEVESPGTFTKLLKALSSELNPCGIIEEMLVERIAYCYWGLGRIATLKRPHMINWLRRSSEIEWFWHNPLTAGMFRSPPREYDENHGSELQEREPSALREARQCIVDYDECSKEQAQELTEEEALLRAIEIKEAFRQELEERGKDIASLLSGIPTSDMLYRYETTIEARFYKSLHELERLQRLRGGQSVPPPLAIDLNPQG